MDSEEVNEWEDIVQLYTEQQDEFGRISRRNFREIVDHFDVDGDRLLDVACGDGTFAVHAAGQGFDVTGVDQSSGMLELSEQRAAEEGVDVTLVQSDMRELEFTDEFDVVTCWYNSVNYLRDLADLRDTFEGVSDALRRDGVFAFDFINDHRLELFAERPSYVSVNTDDLFEVNHNVEYDPEERLLSVDVTGFLKEDGAWTRVDETHVNRGFESEEVRDLLEDAGFSRVTFWGDVDAKTDPTPESERIWTVAEV